MRLIQDLREFIELLNSENVQYLVIGGWAQKRDFLSITPIGNPQRIKQPS